MANMYICIKAKSDTWRCICGCIHIYIYIYIYIHTYIHTHTRTPSELCDEHVSFCLQLDCVEVCRIYLATLSVRLGFSVYDSVSEMS